MNFDKSVELINDFPILKNIFQFFEKEGFFIKLKRDLEISENQLNKIQDIFINDSVERGLESYFECVVQSISIHITSAELFFDLCRLKKDTYITFIRLLNSVYIGFSKNRFLFGFSWLNYCNVKKFLTITKDINLLRVRGNEIEVFKEILCFIAPEWEIKQLFYDIDKDIGALLVNEVTKTVKDRLEKKKLLDDLMCSIKQSIDDYKKTFAQAE
ncbi:hypothetical protein AAGG74_15720 [Bacillus mexicanus]|uniref:hypothetical protein n=1 Tax=Bacillus mexicanus TaxID=2834415 RepID=UPI003D1CC790